ncbi:helix-turn-helix transcriptional regulator [Niallia endozanthoxylica]|uniref:Helix-turn-helix domain-containing protein n=1 Tax=Niallia endozanthoxylica TaxID=2036016 RepID=A0A5J5HI99_9BACI|nr:helix-turn-helix transcriptional regulator [Niallia endozanthoxylica]KAA9020001.1 helix-turn-helix domain-containing protein [Niallia endozanthoxylica]
MDEIYTPDEVAKLFKISKHTVYELIKRGELRAFKVGNKMRIEQNEVNRYKQQMETTPASRPSAAHSIRLAGSHDFLIEHLVKYAARQTEGLSIQPTYVGSLEGLMMLYRNNCDAAAIHLLDPSSKEYNIPFIKQLFVHEPLTVMRFASREQGLIVAKGNPKNINSLHDLTREDVVFVNRQKGSGTRYLIDYFLAEEGINPQAINGYKNEEWTHFATAALVNGGKADTTFGIQSATENLQLDFIPIVKEPFDLVFRWTKQNKPALKQLIDMLTHTAFKDSIGNKAGYDVSESGTIIYEHK